MGNLAQGDYVADSEDLIAQADEPRLSHPLNGFRMRKVQRQTPINPGFRRRNFGEVFSMAPERRSRTRHNHGLPADREQNRVGGPRPPNIPHMPKAEATSQPTRLDDDYRPYQ
jgi:hypothetical protein